MFLLVRRLPVRFDSGLIYNSSNGRLLFFCFQFVDNFSVHASLIEELFVVIKDTKGAIEWQEK
jgi:hypothetical protein